MSDYFGKYIYINLWASWCGACHLYFDAEKILYKSYSPKDIIFLDIALESRMNFNQWKEYSGKKGLTGTQLLYKGDFSSKICKDLNIDGIPRFMLLNKDGTILNPNAPNPEGEDIYLYFEKLGIEKIK